MKAPQHQAQIVDLPPPIEPQGRPARRLPGGERRRPKHAARAPCKAGAGRPSRFLSEGRDANVPSPRPARRSQEHQEHRRAHRRRDHTDPGSRSPDQQRPRDHVGRSPGRCRPPGNDSGKSARWARTRRPGGRSRAAPASRRTQSARRRQSTAPTTTAVASTQPDPHPGNVDADRLRAPDSPSISASSSRACADHERRPNQNRQARPAARWSQVRPSRPPGSRYRGPAARGRSSTSTPRGRTSMSEVFELRP